MGWRLLASPGAKTVGIRRRLPIPLAIATATLMIGQLAVGPLRSASAEESASWRFAPAEAPNPPSGAPAAPYPVPVGEVGQISFWAPNRGLLITGGTEAVWNGPVGAGLYAYNGVSWHQLATVCGGAQGRIAWAGPDEFWTISDQRAGQLVQGQQSTGLLSSISLCHFDNGAVVGSYAMPLEQTGSYLPMDAAACYTPSDCWFGGQDGRAPNGGAFHLHWDGQSVSVVYEPEDHAVTDMALFQGSLYESVQIQPGDAYLPTESTTQPAVIHTIAPTGSAEAFSDLFMFSEGPAPAYVGSLPAYGEGVSPVALAGFSLGSDGQPTGEAATQLWAAANPAPEHPRNTNAASLTVLRLANGVWSQILPSPGAGAGAGSPFPASTRLGGTASTPVGEGPPEQGTSSAVAPEPGSNSAWLSLVPNAGSGAEVALLNADGTLAEPPQTLPGPQDPVGFRGVAGPIACPASHDCWMATNQGINPATASPSVPGWLFHLTDGVPLAPDTDPNFAQLITYRPPDSGLPVIYPDAPPLDDSLANQQSSVAPAGASVQPSSSATKPPKRKPLVEHLKSRFEKHRVLIISFTLTGRAHVQLIASRKRRVVAKTRNESLRAGSHQISLALNPAHWPTGLDFKATPIGATTGGGSGSSGGSNDTVSTG